LKEAAGFFSVWKEALTKFPLAAKKDSKLIAMTNPQYY
jgi:hypothetical protein